MRHAFLLGFYGFMLLFASCKLQPSANMKDYASYFVTDTQQSGSLKITYFGTSTLLFDDGKTQILVDGFFSRPGVLKTALGKVKSNEKRVKAVLEKYGINRLAAVFVCHSHYDHVLDAPTICKLTHATLYGSSSTLMVGRGAGLPESQMSEYEPGKELSLGNFYITVISSKHTPPLSIMGKSNATDPAHPNITEPIKQPATVEKFVEGGTFDIYLRHHHQKILVKASTNYIENALTKYPTDILFLGSAMLGKMDTDFQEKFYRHTVAASGAKMVIPIHWDNFMRPLSRPLKALPRLADNVDQGLDFLIQKTHQDSITFRLMHVGSPLYLP